MCVAATHRVTAVSASWLGSTTYLPIAARNSSSSTAPPPAASTPAPSWSPMPDPSSGTEALCCTVSSTGPPVPSDCRGSGSRSPLRSPGATPASWGAVPVFAPLSCTFPADVEIGTAAFGDREPGTLRGRSPAAASAARWFPRASTPADRFAPSGAGGCVSAWSPRRWGMPWPGIAAVGQTVGDVSVVLGDIGSSIDVPLWQGAGRARSRPLQARSFRDGCCAGESPALGVGAPRAALLRRRLRREVVRGLGSKPRIHLRPAVAEVSADLEGVRADPAVAPLVEGLHRHAEVDRDLLRRGQRRTARTTGIGCGVGVSGQGAPSREWRDGQDSHRLPATSSGIVRKFHGRTKRHFTEWDQNRRPESPVAEITPESERLRLASSRIISTPRSMPAGTEAPGQNHHDPPDRRPSDASPISQRGTIPWKSGFAELPK